jgi:hypothetical protein
MILFVKQKESRYIQKKSSVVNKHVSCKYEMLKIKMLRDEK